LKVESKVLKFETLSTETVESGWRANHGNCSFTPTSIPDLYIYVGDRLAWNPFEHFSRMVLTVGGTTESCPAFKICFAMTTESEFCVRAPKSIVFLRLGLSYTPK
jgi:hypothetical protein